MRRRSACCAAHRGIPTGHRCARLVAACGNIPSNLYQSAFALGAGIWYNALVERQMLRSLADARLAPHAVALGMRY